MPSLALTSATRCIYHLLQLFIQCFKHVFWFGYFSFHNYIFQHSIGHYSHKRTRYTMAGTIYNSILPPGCMPSKNRRLTTSFGKYRVNDQQNRLSAFRPMAIWPLYVACIFQAFEYLLVPVAVPVLPTSPVPFVYGRLYHTLFSPTTHQVRQKGSIKTSASHHVAVLSLCSIGAIALLPLAICFIK